jgi:hypothetical protein
VNRDLAHLIVTFLLSLGLIVFGLLLLFALFTYFEGHR